MPATTRWGLRYPTESTAADVPVDLQNLAQDLDGVAMDDQGLLANRPVSTVGSPGKKGRYYFATDTSLLYRDNGTGWNVVGALSSGGGNLSARPAATTVVAGSFYYAQDQDVLYRSDGTNWARIGLAAGDMAEFMGASAPAGWVLLQGQNVARTGIYADLFAQWGTTFGAGDGSTTFTLPDRRGRVGVAAGTHADVATIGANDGVAVANRRPKHRTSMSPANARVYDTSVSTINSSAGDSAGADSQAALLTVGTGNANDPLDTPAYIVVNVKAKL